MIIILGGSSSLGSNLLRSLAKKEKILCFYNKNKPHFKKKNVEYFKLNLENFKLSDLTKNNFSKKIKNQKITLINFASIKIDKLSLFINDNELSRTLNVNFISFFKIIKFLLPKMIEKKWGRGEFKDKSGKVLKLSQEFMKDKTTAKKKLGQLKKGLLKKYFE